MNQDPPNRPIDIAGAGTTVTYPLGHLSNADRFGKDKNKVKRSPTAQIILD